jgi:hypothetical protein
MEQAFEPYKTLEPKSASAMGSRAVFETIHVVLKAIPVEKKESVPPVVSKI